MRLVIALLATALCGTALADSHMPTPEQCKKIETKCQNHHGKKCKKAMKKCANVEKMTSGQADQPQQPQQAQQDQQPAQPQS